MKKYWFYLIGCFFSLWLVTSSTKAVNPGGAVGLGVGFPEFWHVSGRMSLSSALQSGCRFFIYSDGEQDLKSLTFDLQYHWKKNVKNIDDRSPWFVSLGVTFMVDDDENRRFEDTYLLVGVGWEQRLMNHIGWQIDGGLGARLRHSRENKKFFLDVIDDYYYVIIPFLRIQVFSFF